jgi:hypothetical protein
MLCYAAAMPALDLTPLRDAVAHLAAGLRTADGDAMARLLGRAAYETMLHWPELNAKWADTWHRKIVQVKYRSDDQPEDAFPELNSHSRQEEDER